MIDQPKILVIDIETRPILYYGWGMYNQNHSPNQIVEMDSILCFAAKWFNNRDMFFYSVWTHSEKEMLQAAADLIAEADMLVTKNGERFDIAWFTREFVKHGIKLPPPTTHVDLEKTLRNKMRFPTTKLELVAPYFGAGKKQKHEGFELWSKVIDGDPKAQRTMQRYCMQDVRVTDRLYRIMRAAIPNHPHMGFTGPRECGACGSKHVHVSKYRRTKTMRIQQLHCQNCGSYFDGVRQKV
jgi:DNA polymerase elongation subunit (family B)